MKQTKNGTKYNNFFHERHKDNLWFINQYLKSDLMYSSSIIEAMFTFMDLNTFDNIINDKVKNKTMKFKNLVYKNKKDCKKKKNNKNEQIYILDKESNIVYHNNKYYGTYQFTYVAKNHMLYDKTKLIKTFQIYDHTNEMRLIVYPQLRKYEIVQNVFEDFEDITYNENHRLAYKLDKELTRIKSLMIESISKTKKSNNTSESNEDIIQHYSIKNDVITIINQLYYSNLDLNKTTYNLIDRYLRHIKDTNETYFD